MKASEIIVSFRVNNINQEREFLGIGALLGHLESREDIFTPSIYTNQATGESYTKQEFVRLADSGQIDGYNFEGDDDDRPDAQYTDESSREIGLTNAMAQSGIGCAEVGDWSYYSQKLSTLSLSHDEELILFFDRHPEYVKEYFSGIESPAPMSLELAKALAALCDGNGGEISPILAAFVQDKLGVSLPTYEFSSDEWGEVLDFVADDDEDGLSDYVDELTA